MFIKQHIYAQRMPNDSHCHDRKMTPANASDQYLDQYGRGLCYSLALLLSHEANFKYVLAEVEVMAAEGAIRFEGTEQADEKYRQDTLDRLACVRWFSRAANPIRNLEIPIILPEVIQTRLKELKNKCQRWSFPNAPEEQPTKHDVRWAIEEAKELIRQIDEHHGIRTAKESAHVQAVKEPSLIFRDDDAAIRRRH